MTHHTETRESDQDMNQLSVQNPREQTSTDLLLRYCLVGLGVMPASSLLHISAKKKQILICVYILLTLILFIAPIYAMVLTLDSAGVTLDIIYPCMVIVLCWTSTLNSVAYLITGNLMKSFEQFYGQLAALEKLLLLHNILVNNEKRRKATIYAIVVASINALVFMGLFVYEYAQGTLGIEPIFKPLLSSSILYECVLGYIGAFAVIWNGPHVAFRFVYLLRSCGEVILYLTSFNKKLIESVEHSAQEVYEQLENYRRTHLELCKLVEMLDKVFSMDLGIFIAGYTVVILLTSYLATLGEGNEGGLRSLCLYWAVVCLVCISVVIGVCHAVTKKVAESRSSLLLLMQTVSFDPEKPESNFQLNLFLEQLREPPSLTMAGLLNVDKDLWFTISGLLLTYYIFMAQIKGSSTEPFNHNGTPSGQPTSGGIAPNLSTPIPHGP